LSDKLSWRFLQHNKKIFSDDLARIYPDDGTSGGKRRTPEVKNPQSLEQCGFMNGRWRRSLPPRLYQQQWLAGMIADQLSI
jgi:hypothetical protein